MGVIFNVGNELFRSIKTPNYVDKTGLLAEMNKTIGKEDRLTCMARPRRFGKSYAAMMVASYYCKGYDSAPLFDDLEVAEDASYRIHMNQYNVMFLDISAYLSEIRDRMELVPKIRKMVMGVLLEMYPDVVKDTMTLPVALEAVVEKDGSKFIAVIDEWDAPIRDREATEKSKWEYLEFLRGLFKNSELTNKIFAAAYMTGILPVKKDGSQSAISEFNEYTIMEPFQFARFFGFTESEARMICEKSGMDYAQIKKWYNGYALSGVGSIYNPNSVMQATRKRKVKSYWSQSAAAGSVLKYINMDFQGLGEKITKLLAGIPVGVNTYGFQNDTTSFSTADDVLTLLIYFGYLSFEEETRTVRIPNKEIEQEFENYIHKVTHIETIRRVQESEKILEATIHMDAEAVAAGIQKIHNEQSSMRHYNNEQALRAVIKLAYFSYMDHYIQLEELDSGTGYADIVYIPKRYSDYPALVVELKVHGTAEGAVQQIKDRNYPQVLEGYGSEILLVGISYDKDGRSKKHTCVIEKVAS